MQSEFDKKDSNEEERSSAGLNRLGENSETRPFPYNDDPLYKELLLSFQNADWEACFSAVDRLLAKYPKEASLLAFRDEINVKHTFHTINLENEQLDRRERVKRTLTRGALVFAGVAVIVVAVLLGYQKYQDNLEAARLEREQQIQYQQLTSQYANAENYMSANRYREALTIFENIQAVDPEFKDISEKITLAEKMLAIETQYQEGIQLQNDGEDEQALQIYLDIQDQAPDYRDTLTRVQQIENKEKIAQLVVDAKSAYAQEDWQGMISAYEEAKSLDPGVDLSTLDENLFVSYMNMIVDIADKSDATIEDIAVAEEYYRSALALFPQSKDFAGERAELQKIAINLLANKYYIYAMDLLQQGNYSIESLQESLKYLNKANGIGTGSPTIEKEIANAQLFMTGYDDFINRRWDSAISGLEQLERTSQDYANGMAGYLLYEAYMARGDTLASFSDYAGARDDYGVAETYAWGEGRSALQLFQVEIRLAYVLRRLSLYEESTEYYRYAFELVDFYYQIPSDKATLISTLDEADYAYSRRDYWNASRLYEAAVEEVAVIYAYETVEALRGDSLVQLAYDYGSTIDAIRAANGLGDAITLRADQELEVPIVVEE